MAAGMIVAIMLLRKLSRAFSILEEQLDVSEPLYLHGVDSLVALELRNWFAKEFTVDVEIFDLLSAAAVTYLYDLYVHICIYIYTGTKSVLRGHNHVLAAPMNAVTV